MELNSGYKHTEVGVIPDVWDVVSIGNLITEFRGGASLKPSDFTRTGIKILPKGGVGKTGWLRIEDDDLKFCSPEYAAANYRNQVDETYTIIVLRDLVPSGPSIGLMVQIRNKDSFVLAQGVYGFKVTQATIPGYLVQLSNTHWYRKLANSIMVGSTQVHITNTAFKRAQIPLPPLAEQEAIAGALSDADALIESLERLIAKKRLVKQGAMQELFQPQTSEDVRLLEDVSSLKGRIGWQGLKQSEFTDNENEPFLITGMNFKDGAIRWNEVYHISEERYEMAKDIQLRPGDVLMTKDGTIGKVLYIDQIPLPGKASLNSHLLLFRPIQDSYHPKYLYYQLSSRRFTDFVELSKSGSTFFGLSQAAVGKYPVLLPPLAEQTAIAAVLSDMDAEIAALEEKLAKARQLKQGMMQELLTGRIRLI